MTGEVLVGGGTGAEGLEAFVDSRRRDVNASAPRCRTSTTSGLSLSKLTLAANLLGDLARA